jgi:hypothetical protein
MGTVLVSIRVISGLKGDNYTPYLVQVGYAMDDNTRPVESVDAEQTLSLQIWA